MRVKENPDRKNNIFFKYFFLIIFNNFFINVFNVQMLSVNALDGRCCVAFYCWFGTSNRQPGLL